MALLRISNNHTDIWGRCFWVDKLLRLTSTILIRGVSALAVLRATIFQPVHFSRWKREYKASPTFYSNISEHCFNQLLCILLIPFPHWRIPSHHSNSFIFYHSSKSSLIILTFPKAFLNFFTWNNFQCYYSPRVLWLQ